MSLDYHVDDHVDGLLGIGHSLSKMLLNDRA